IATADPRARAHVLDPGQVERFIAMNADGTVPIFWGKVDLVIGFSSLFSSRLDLGTALRIAIPQMSSEELGIPVDRIRLVEGDSALTPDQGATAGSTGIMRGGVQIRQAAATAREALIALASTRTGKPAAQR